VLQEGNVEVDEKAELSTGGLQIGEKLGGVHGR